MDENGFRPGIGIVASVPMSLLLAGLFFAPWVRLSCRPEAITDDMPSGQFPAGMQIPDDAREIAQASGWQLAGGDLSLQGQYKEQEEQFRRQTQDQEIPRARPWVYACLAIPIGLLVVGAMGAVGMIRTGGGGWLLLLAATGLGFTMAVARVEYVDDAMDEARKDFDKAKQQQPLGFRNEMEGAIAEAETRMKETLPTEATPYLWVSMGLYALVGFCGVATMVNPGQAAASARQEFHHDRRQQASDPFGRPARPGGLASHPPPVAAPRSGSEPLEFGPSITADNTSSNRQA